MGMKKLAGQEKVFEAGRCQGTTGSLKQNKIKKKHHVAFSVAFSVEESSVILVMTILIFHH